MRIHRSAAATGLVLCLFSSATLAQDDAVKGVVAGEAMPAMPAPAKVESPSMGWTDAEKAAEQVAKGKAALEACQKAYQSAPGLTDKAKITVQMPDGMQTDTMEMAFGSGNDMRLTMGSLQVVSAGDTVYFVPDQPADKYIARKIEGNVNSTLAQMLPGFAVPAPGFTLRQPIAGRPVTDAFAMGAPAAIEVKGFRERDGAQEVLLAGQGAEGLVRLDPKTSFVTMYRMVITPEGLPEEIKIGFNVALEPKAGALEKPITFDGGKRTAVKGVEELFDAGDMGAPEEPEVKVKVGDMAPLAELVTLDGKKVDLASYKGKVVVIDFWATWCGPCRKGLPGLQKFADEMKGNDKVVVHPVNVWERTKGDDLTKAVGEFWTKQGFTMQVLLDTEAKFIGQYGFQGIPACIVIGPDGKLVSTHIGYDPKMGDTLKAEVEKALGAGK
ncbi:MAG: TlpA family protein disulfide reductase [Actinobacteria bacterium]|nr:TlpA family protein disulfide reductase [Actinomycetota bacterium]